MQYSIKFHWKSPVYKCLKVAKKMRNIPSPLLRVLMYITEVCGFSCWEKRRSERQCWRSPPTCCTVPGGHWPWTCWPDTGLLCQRIWHYITALVWSCPATLYGRTRLANRNLLYLVDKRNTFVKWYWLFI